MDAATIGVLKDVAILVWIAIVLGAAAYKAVRMIRPGTAWNFRGRVEARLYLPVDAILIAAISISALLLAGMQMQTSIVQAEPAEVPKLTAVPIFVSIALQLLVCVALLFYLRSVRVLSPADLFGLRRFSVFKAVALGLAFIVPTLVMVNSAAYGITEWMRNFWPELNAQEAVQAFQNTEDVAVRVLLMVAAVVVAPLVEETVFRGFVYGVIKRYTDGYFAALCSALLFALVHFHVGSLFPLALLALILCLAYEMTGSLLVPMAMHALFNATSIVALSLGLGK